MAVKLVKKSKPKTIKQAAKNISSHSIKMATKTEHPDKSVSEQNVEVPVATVVPMCTVGISGGLTVNLGNYNSAKFSVSLSMPAEAKDVESTFEFIKKWVENKITQMQKEAGLDPTPNKASEDF